MAQEIFPLKICSLRALQYRLGFDRELLWDVAETAGRYYRPFPKYKGDKVRWIDNPVGILKELQGRIQDRLLSSIVFPDHIQGGVTGRSPITNASAHVGAPLVVMLDVRKCFPSITNKHIFHAWRTMLGCTPTISHLLTKLTTYEGHLPQGAPTSTTLANIVLARCDEEIRIWCSHYGITYTRFVDDLVFSGNSARSVINNVVEVLKRNGFRAPHAKQKIMGPRVRHQITGVVANTTLGVAREKRAKVRAEIHRLRFIENPDKAKKAALSIQGRIGFVSQANPRSGASLRKLLDENYRGE